MMTTTRHLIEVANAVVWMDVECRRGDIDVSNLRYHGQPVKLSRLCSILDIRPYDVYEAVRAHLNAETQERTSDSESS